jgi:co-chaperonin GroES (HSP10)
MKHIRNYIIKIEGKEFNDTFKTEGGLTLYGDKDFTYKKQVNSYAKIVEKPMNGGSLEIGTEVFIDPTVFYHFHHEDNRKHDSVFTIDRKQGLYHIDPQMIILYKEDNEWKGFQDNLLGIQEYVLIDDIISNGIILDFDKKKQKQTVKIVYSNDFLKENEIENGSQVYLGKVGGIPVYIDGKEYLWLRSNDIIAVENGEVSI